MDVSYAQPGFWGTLTQLGVGGILAILILKEVFSFLNKRRNGKRGGVDFVKMSSDISRLVELHAPTDEDGVPLWYVRRSFEREVAELSSLIESQSGLLREMLTKYDAHLNASRG